MSDTYDAAFSVCSRQFQSMDIVVRDAVMAAIDPSVIASAIASIRDAALEAAVEHQRPSVLYRPSLALDGSAWCALYGSNVQEGVCGFGSSPAEAMADFDRAWTVRRG